jgi:hypothetical protein
VIHRAVLYVTRNTQGKIVCDAGRNAIRGAVTPRGL